MNPKANSPPAYRNVLACDASIHTDSRCDKKNSGNQACVADKRIHPRPLRTEKICMSFNIYDVYLKHLYTTAPCFVMFSFYSRMLRATSRLLHPPPRFSALCHQQLLRLRPGPLRGAPRGSPAKLVSAAPGKQESQPL